MQSILRQFPVGSIVSCEPLGNGHINRTHLVISEAGTRFVLQEINHHVFRDVPGLMANFAAVCAHLHTKDADPRHALRLIRTHAGETFHRTPDGRHFRMLDYIDGVCPDAPESPEDLRQAGLAFGQFQRLMADFPAETLTETIPRFHDTPDRFRLLRQAIAEDRAGRLSAVQAEVEALLHYEAEADTLTGLNRAGQLPLRVTHHDTKLNNVMLDAVTRRPLCVMDLDTVMPGLVAHDFGDAIRTGASTAAEDETDLTLVHVDPAMYRAFASGFLAACRDSLTPTEIETLPWGAKLMTLENAVRFLTDHLNGDVYFRIHRPGHNLDRCRAQLALVRDMERQWALLCRIVQECAAAC